MLGGVAAVILAFFVYLVGRVAQPDMELLYAQLDPSESGQIVSELEARGVSYTVSADGGSIRVPADQVARMRLAMAEQGLPSGGSLGYEIFDRGEGLGTSSFVQNVNHVRALEGELSRTIRSLGGVQNARVHLVLPQRELFSRERNEPSASIVLSLGGQRRMDPQQVRAIQQLVAAAVPRMRPDSVAVIDDRGNLLARTSTGDAATDLLGTAEERRLALENRLSRAAEELLERSVGFGNVRVEVTADLEYDRVTENAEIYDPDGRVVRSTQTVEEMNEDGAGDAPVTVGGNLPDAELLPLDGGGGGGRSSRTEETVNYEISRTMRTHIRESGAVRRLSVAVLINGTHIEGPEGETVFEPRSEQELERLAALARSAVGFDPNRGDSFEIASLPFAEVVPFAHLDGGATVLGLAQRDLMRIAELLVLGVVAVLALLLVVRPLVGRLLTAEGGAEGGAEGLAGALPGFGGFRQPALAGPGGGTASPGLLTGPPGSQVATALEGGAGGMTSEMEEAGVNITQIEGALRASSVRKISELVERHPQETVSIIRTWLYQES